MAVSVIAHPRTHAARTAAALNVTAFGSQRHCTPTHAATHAATHARKHARTHDRKHARTHARTHARKHPSTQANSHARNVRGCDYHRHHGHSALRVVGGDDVTVADRGEGHDAPV